MKIEQNIGKIGELIIPKDVKSQIDYLHKKVGSTEWNAIMLVKPLNDNLNKLKDLKFEVRLVYLMDIGSAAYTSHNFEGDLVEAFDLIPDGMECKMAGIHSHHTMATFFSQTDVSELEDNGGKYNYYISLIVNFSGEWNCKMVIPSETITECSYKIRNDDGEFKTIKRKYEEKFLIEAELEVVKDEIPVDQWFGDRFSVVKTAKEVKATNVKAFNNPTTGYYKYADNQRDTSKEYDYSYYEYLKSGMFPESVVQNTPVESSLEIFVKCLLLGTTETNNLVPLDEAIKRFNLLAEDELGVLEDILDTNLDIIHYNVYGSSDYMALNKTLKSAIGLLENHSTKFTHDSYNFLLDFIELEVNV